MTPTSRSTTTATRSSAGDGPTTTHHYVQARTRSAAGAYGPRENLVANTTGVDDPAPAVAADASTDAVVAWQRLNDPLDVIQFSHGPVTEAGRGSRQRRRTLLWRP